MSSQVRVAVLKAAGTNCDGETTHAFTLAGALAEDVWVEELKTDPKRLKEFQILAIPGGFTYGDDLGAGKLLANELAHRLKDALAEFLDRPTLVLGVCNGFQALVKAGILPSGKVGASQELTLTVNDSGKFEDRWVFLRQEFNVSIWTQGIEGPMELPVAHGEGKLLPKDQTVLEQLLGFGQIVFHYADPSGGEARYPWNPNGSVGDIAGICDPTGRILGLMPHPERHVSFLQHPGWRKGEPEREGHGLRIFRNGVNWAARHL